MSSDLKHSLKVLGIIITGVFVLGFMLCTGITGGDALLCIAFGWLMFLGRVLPEVTVRWDVVWSGAVLVTLLVVGSHLFIRWLCGQLMTPAQPATSVDAPSTPPANAWKWRWTFGALLLVTVMFASGTAAIGIVRQTTALFSARRIFYSGISERALRAKCASNLHIIGQAMMLYAQDHAGQFPDDLPTLIMAMDMNPDVCTCPSTDDEKAHGPTTKETLAALYKPEHCSYIYLAKGLNSKVEADRVLAIERPANHDGAGFNVLYGDGHVEFEAQPWAKLLLTKLGLDGNGRPTTRP